MLSPLSWGGWPLSWVASAVPTGHCCPGCGIDRRFAGRQSGARGWSRAHGRLQPTMLTSPPRGLEPRGWAGSDRKAGQSGPPAARRRSSRVPHCPRGWDPGAADGQALLTPGEPQERGQAYARLQTPPPGLFHGPPPHPHGTLCSCSRQGTLGPAGRQAWGPLPEGARKQQEQGHGAGRPGGGSAGAQPCWGPGRGHQPSAEESGAGPGWDPPSDSPTEDQPVQRRSQAGPLRQPPMPGPTSRLSPQAGFSPPCSDGGFPLCTSRISGRGGPQDGRTVPCPLSSRALVACLKCQPAWAQAAGTGWGRPGALEETGPRSRRTPFVQPLVPGCWLRGVCGNVTSSLPTTEIQLVCPRGRSRAVPGASRCHHVCQPSLVLGPSPGRKRGSRDLGTGSVPLPTCGTASSQRLGGCWGLPAPPLLGLHQPRPQHTRKTLTRTRRHSALPSHFHPRWEWGEGRGRQHSGVHCLPTHVYYYWG